MWLLSGELILFSYVIGREILAGFLCVLYTRSLPVIRRLLFAISFWGFLASLDLFFKTNSLSLEMFFSF